MKFGRGVEGLGFGVSVLAAVAIGWGIRMDDVVGVVGNVGFGGAMLAGMQLDKHSHSHDHGHANEPKEVKAPSAITKALMRMTESIPLVHSILLERDSRRIFYFMWYVSVYTESQHEKNCLLTSL